MSSTFLRGLHLLEILDHHGPLTVTELAQRTGIDKGAVSRMVSASVADGWMVRAERKISLGPRCVLLGRHGLGSDLVSQAEPLVHAVAGVTGSLTQVYGLVGAKAVLLASASGQEEISFPGEDVPGPLHSTAAGRAIAALLTADQLDAVLPPEPFPDGSEFVASMNQMAAQAMLTPFLAEGAPSAPVTVATTRQDLEVQLAQLRVDGAAFDRGDVYPTLGCIAVPWAHRSLPAALACLASPSDIAAKEDFYLTCLNAAARPAATPRDVIAAAAEQERVETRA
jgi:DNA-binding IclR family transcriptional regulator